MLTTAEPDALMQTTAAALLLPGMSLNATIFPDLGIPSISPNLSDIDLGPRGDLSTPGLTLYTRILEAAIGASGCWKRSTRRIVVGHSFGGMLALWWLLNRNREELQHVDGLVLIATTAGPMFDRVRMKLPKLLGRECRIGLHRLIPLWNRPFVTKTVKRLLCGGQLSADQLDFATLGISSDAQLDLAGWRNTDWRAMRAYRTSLADFDVRERLGEIDVPTIILHGTDDSLFEVTDAQFLAAGLPKADLRLVTGAGHALPLTHGEEVVKAVSTLMTG